MEMELERGARERETRGRCNSQAGGRGRLAACFDLRLRERLEGGAGLPPLLQRQRHGRQSELGAAQPHESDMLYLLHIEIVFYQKRLICPFPLLCLPNICSQSAASPLPQHSPPRVRGPSLVQRCVLPLPCVSQPRFSGRRRRRRRSERKKRTLRRERGSGRRGSRSGPVVSRLSAPPPKALHIHLPHLTSSQKSPLPPVLTPLLPSLPSSGPPTTHPRPLPPTSSQPQPCSTSSGSRIMSPPSSWVFTPARSSSLSPPGVWGLPSFAATVPESLATMPGPFLS